MDKSELAIFALCLESALANNEDQPVAELLDGVLLRFNLAMRDDEAEHFLTI